MIDFISHLARDADTRFTVCGEPWQDWQAPMDTPESDVIASGRPRGHGDPRGGPDRIRPCRACMAVYRQGAPAAAS